MRKKILQFLIILAMSVQLVPDSFVRIIAEDTSSIHNEYIRMQTETTPDATLGKDAQLPKQQSRLHVIVSYKEEVKEECYFVFNADHNPGKIIASALENYKIESINVDGNLYQGEAITFDRESGFLNKEVVIKVIDATKESEKDKNQSSGLVQSVPPVQEPVSIPTVQLPYTPQGANFLIVSGAGTSTDPYIIDISNADVYLPGDPAIIPLSNNDFNDTNRYQYTFAKDYDYIYEAMLNMGGEGYKLLRTYGIRGLEYGKTYKVKDPMDGSALAWVNKNELQSAVITYDANTYIKDGIRNKWMIHYNYYANKANITIHYVFDGVENKNLTQNMTVKAGDNSVSSFGFPAELKSEGTYYRYHKTAMTLQGDAVDNIHITSNKSHVYVHYNSDKVKVSFDPNGGCFNFLDYETKTYSIVKGSKMVEAVPTPKKFSKSSFLGWYTKDNQKYDKNMSFHQDVMYYARWANEKTDFYILKKGLRQPILNEPDDSYKYFKYGEGYLVDKPLEVHDETKVKEQILQVPAKRAITKDEYCVIKDTVTANCKGYGTDQYEPVWYRTIEVDKNEWHVDGYIREKTKINLEFNLMRAGKTEYTYFTNIDMEKGSKLSAWPEGTPEKIKVEDVTYIFSGWYTDVNRTQKASLDTVYAEEQVGNTVKLYAGYVPSRKLSVQVEGSDVLYDGKEHGLKSVTPSIQEGVTILYASEQPELEKSWSTKQPTSTNVCDKTVYVKATSDQYEESDYVSAQLKISKRKITLTTTTSSQVYNGKELRDDRVNVSGVGLANSQTMETLVEGAIRNVGKVDNILKHFQIFDANHNIVNENYEVEIKNGVLSITEAGSNENTITVGNTDVNYDGLKKTVGSIEKKNPNASVWYSSNGLDQWTTTKPFFTNAGSYDVYVQARDTNYHDSEIVKAKVIIHKLEVTLTANSCSKVFDGKPLYAKGYVMVGKLANEQSIAVKVSGEIVNVQENGVSTIVAWDILDANKESTKENYHVTLQKGTLTIQPAPADKNKISVEKVEVTYDGEAHSIGDVTKQQRDSKIQYFINGKWIDKAPTYKEANTYTVKIKAVHPNYMDSTVAEAVVIIKKRELTVTAKSLSKVYDGTPLVAKGFDMEGSLAKQQSMDVFVSGSIRSANEKGFSSITGYTLKDADGRDVSHNYNVQTKDGSLKIEKAPSRLNPLTIEHVDVVYDGYSHGLYVQAAQNDSKILYSKDGEHWQEELQYVNTCDKKVYVKAQNPNYLDTEAVIGTIRITQRPITVSSASASKVFDTTPLTAHSFMVSEGTIAREQNVQANVTGSITNVGETLNTLTNVKVFDEDLDVTDNYKVTVKTGILKVTKNAIENTITVDDVDVTYDGLTHKITNVDKKIKDAKVVYSLDLSKQDWSSESPKFVEVGKHVVYVKAQHSDYEDSNIATAFVNVKPRKIEFIAQSANKKYDGTPLTSSGYEISSGSLVEGQKESIQISGSQSVVGESDNIITNVIIKDKDKNTTENYELILKKGKLTIEPGLQKNNTLHIEDVETMYDGENVTIKDGVKSVASATIYYTTNKEDSASWSTKKPSFQDASSYLVYAKAVDPNYQDSKIVSANITIKKRNLVLVAASKTKEYDGTPLTLGNSDYSIKEGTSLVTKQKITDIILAGSILDCGEVNSVASGIVIKDTNDTNVSANYDVQYVAGTLRITKAKANLNTISAQNNNNIYDGESHSISNISTSVKDANVQYSRNNKDWVDTLPSFTEVGSYTIYMKATHKNYEDSITTMAVSVITPRKITITPKDEYKIYDGTPLKASQYTMSENALVKEQIASVELLGEQRSAGKSMSNIGEVIILSGKNDVTSNYAITKGTGNLFVEKANADQNKVFVEDTKADYDGENHTIGKVETTIEDSHVLYSKDKKEWTKNAPSFTEVGTYEIYLKTVHENYQDSEISTGHVVIKKRTITLTAKSASKVFDQVALVEPGYTLSENALVKDQNIKVEIQGFQQEVGMSENIVRKVTIFSHTSDKTNNYDIKTVNGILQVTPLITPLLPTPQLPTPQLPIPPFVRGIVTVNPVEQVVNNRTPKADNKEVVKRKDTPKALNKGTWALCNLLLAVGTLLLAICLWLSKCKKEDEEEEQEEPVIYARKRWLKVTSSCIAILSTIIFCLSEDMTLKMVFMDSWTSWMAVFFIIQVGMFYFGRKWKQEDTQQEDYTIE